MPDDSDPFREGITEYLQREAPSAREDGAICTGWALITEWMEPNGDRYLARTYAHNITHWQAKGMWFEALHGNWPDGGDE